jgi:8-oxo-dGTP pyrophosphatase MutT (NUDIX family)
MTGSLSRVLPVGEYVTGLTRKRMAAGVLMRDRQGRVLLLKTSYKSNLEVPGGAVEADEAPWDTAVREVREELGWNRQLGRLLVVDYVLPQDSRPEGVVFLFDGGVLDEADLMGLVFGDGEILSADFYVLDQARPQLKPLVADRLAAGLDAIADRTTVLCRHGRPIA